MNLGERGRDKARRKWVLTQNNYCGDKQRPVPSLTQVCPDGTFESKTKRAKSQGVITSQVVLSYSLLTFVSDTASWPLSRPPGNAS